MDFTQREKDLITTALYQLEGDCYGDELHFEAVDDLGGTPDGKEVRTLMKRFMESSND